MAGIAPSLISSTERVILQTIRPNRCLAKGAAVLLLLVLVCQVAAAEPTLARLSFWVPPERMEDVVKDFAGDEPQGDDMTCLVLHVEEQEKNP